MKKNEDLNTYVTNYTSFNDRLIRARYELLQRFFVGRTCLEFGPANGEGTEYLLNHFDHVTSVDGSSEAIRDLRKRFPSSKLEAVCSYFETFENSKQYDTVVLAHILEHVDNPHEVLQAARKFLKPGGAMIIDVPNAMSLHRQIGVEMGLLKKVTDLNEGDISIGHKRVYTPQAFQDEVSKADMHIKHFGGVFIKILSNAQSEKTFDERQLRALLTVGERYPEIAGEMYIIAELPQH